MKVEMLIDGAPTVSGVYLAAAFRPPGHMRDVHPVLFNLSTDQAAALAAFRDGRDVAMSADGRSFKAVAIYVMLGRDELLAKEVEAPS